ncbi:MAG: lipid-A-disaccharide synthase [Pseudomonadota bacterium]
MRIFLVAGEPSGDRLGAALMGGLVSLVPDVQFFGVGGPEMTAAGLKSLFPMHELSVMGLAEVLPRYPHLVRRKNQTGDAAIKIAPDALVTIDSPDFGLRVAARVRAAQPSQTTVHYVAPSVWAWRPHRAEKMARHIDHVLALLPFEPPYMEAAGMSCDFVGHPVVAEPRANPDECAEFRMRHGIGAEAKLVLVLPGSRRGEVERLLPVFGESVRQLFAARGDLRVVLPTTENVAERVSQGTSGWPGEPIVLDPTKMLAGDAAAEKRAAFGAADAALAASGTVSLELAAAATPMVIAYDMNWISRHIIARMLKIDTVTLVNLVSESRAVPEFLGAACQPDAIARALLDVLQNPEAQIDAMRLTMERLGEGDSPPGVRAAQSVLSALGNRSSH